MPFKVRLPRPYSLADPWDELYTLLPQTFKCFLLGAWRRLLESEDKRRRASPNVARLPAGNSADFPTDPRDH